MMNVGHEYAFFSARGGFLNAKEPVRQNELVKKSDKRLNNNDFLFNLKMMRSLDFPKQMKAA